jgi:hypothetical protein
MAPISELTSRAEALGDKVNGHPEYIPEVLPELLSMLDQVHVHRRGVRI